jgi:hypothetical protein
VGGGFGYSNNAVNNSNITVSNIITSSLWSTCGGDGCSVNISDVVLVAVNDLACITINNQKQTSMLTLDNINIDAKAKVTTDPWKSAMIYRGNLNYNITIKNLTIKGGSFGRLFLYDATPGGSAANNTIVNLQLKNCSFTECPVAIPGADALLTSHSAIKAVYEGDSQNKYLDGVHNNFDIQDVTAGVYQLLGRPIGSNFCIANNSDASCSVTMIGNKTIYNGVKYNEQYIYTVDAGKTMYGTSLLNGIFKIEIL